MTIEQLSFNPDEPIEFVDPLRVGVAALINMYGFAEVERMVRMQGPARIVPSAPARPTDPETSHLATKRSGDVGRFSLTSRSAKLLYAFSSSDLTAQQATTRVVGAHAAISAFEGCRRRVSDLLAVGYITDSGGRRHNQGSEDEAIVWALTDEGRKALIRLDETGWSR